MSLLEILWEKIQTPWFSNFSAGFVATLLGFWVSILYYQRSEKNAEARKFLVMLRGLHTEIHRNLHIIYPQILESVNNNLKVFVRFSNQGYQPFLQDASVHRFVGIALVANTSIYLAEVERINRLLDYYNPGEVRQLYCSKLQLLEELREIRKQFQFHSNICTAYGEKKIDWKKKTNGEVDREYYEKLVRETKDLPTHYLKPV